METVEFIFSCAECGFQTLDEFQLDDHMECYHSKRMPKCLNEEKDSSSNHDSTGESDADELTNINKKSYKIYKVIEVIKI